MQTKENTKFGVLRFMPYATFHNPQREDEDARDARVAEIYEGEPTPKHVSDWPQVDNEPICRSGMFVIETSKTSTDNFWAMLHFCPERPSAGRYEIHYPHGKVERGITLRVYPVPDDERDPLVSKLTQFKIRYVVIAESAEQTRRGMIWLVGFHSFRSVDEAAESEMSVPSLPETN